MSLTTRLERAIDSTVGGRRLAAFVEVLRHRGSPWHWTNVFGVITWACMTVLLLSGVFLMLFYTPSSDRVIYDGSYAPLVGVEMSKALESTLGLSFDVRGGLLVRQAHHWAALLLPAAVILQLVVAFFTGAFRRPRRTNWVLLFLLLVAALAAGWSGYALPDDMLSGTGLRIVEGIVLGIPLIGTWTANLLFGGGYPGRIIENLWVVHLLVSVAVVALIGARARVAWVHGAQRFAGVRPEADLPIWPAAARRVLGLFAVAAGVLVVVSATVTVSPIWLYGPSDPGNVSAGSQPDWYTGFLDGALRLVPPGWEIDLFGGTLTLAVLVPLAVIGAFLGSVFVYPFLEGWIMRDRPGADLLDRPRNVPTRTGLGVAGLTFYGVLWGAASSDVVAGLLRLSLDGVITTFQVALFVAPVVAFLTARAVCFGLQRRDRDLLRHGYETGRIVRLPGGEYVEVHKPLPVDAAASIADAGYAPLVLRPDRKGRISLTARVRVALSRLWFRDRIAPVTGSIGVGQGSERDAA